MKKSLILLFVFFFSVFTFAGKKAVLPELLRPNGIAVDDERIYIADGASVFIYSLSDSTLQTKFGQEGEGPSEFKTMQGNYPLELTPFSDSLFVGSMGKISHFSKTGRFLRESLCPLTARGGAVFPVTGGFIGTAAVSENKKSFHSINLYDEQFKLIKELYREENNMQMGNSLDPFSVRPMIRINRDRIFISGSDGIIRNFDHNGNNRPPIQNIYEKVKVLDIHKKKTLDGFKTDPRTKAYYEILVSQIRFPEFFPSIRDYRVDDNKVYVLPYKSENNESLLYIFDFNGKLLQKAPLSIVEKNILELFPFTIKNGTLFQLIENQEEWELHTELIK